MTYQQSEEERDLWDQTTDRDDRKRAEAFGALAEMKFCMGDYATSYTCALESQEIYEKLDDSFGMAEGYYFEGRALRHQRKFGDSVEKLERAAQAFRANANEYFLAAVLYDLAMSYKELRQWALAKNAFASAGDLFRANEKWLESADCYYQAAGQLFQLGEFAQAEFYAHHSLDSYSNTRDFPDISRALKRLGDAYYFQFNLVEARDAYARAAALLDYSPDEGWHGAVLLQQAAVAERLGNIQDANTFLDRVRAMVENPELTMMLAFADVIQARIMQRNGAYWPASQLLNRAVAALGVIKDEDWLIDARFELAKCYFAMDERQQAWEQLEKLMVEAKQMTTPPFSDEPWLMAGNLAHFLGNQIQALEILEEVRVDRLPSKDLIAELGVVRARVYLVSDQYETALRVVDETRNEQADFLTESQKFSLKETEGRALIDLGRTDDGLHVLKALLYEASLAGDLGLAQRTAQWIQQAESRSFQDPTA